MRKLASIQIIKDIQPIPNKDRIGLATMEGLGWHVIINKEDIKVGDKVVYFEIDSVLPKIPYFSFLEKRGYRIRSLKLAGCLSQGLCIPLKDINIILSQL